MILPEGQCFFCPIAQSPDRTKENITLRPLRPLPAVFAPLNRELFNRGGMHLCSLFHRGVR